MALRGAPLLPKQPRDGREERGQHALLALQWPLPKIVNVPRWNVDKCPQGLLCEESGCPHYHSDNERRCEAFDTGHCCGNESDMTAAGGRPRGCVNGLHIHASEVRETYCIDLSSASARKLPRELEKQPREVNANYVRLVVYGFAAIYKDLLRKLLEYMPLVHVMVLPDRERDPHLLVSLSHIVELLGTSNPRLREVVFSGGVVEAIW